MKFVCAVALSCIFSLSAWGQATAGYGGISGTVTDPSGAPIGGAKVIVANPSLGVTRELVTTGAGFFSAQALVPEKGYKVTAEKQGFASYTADGLTLEVGQVLNLKVGLTVGSMAEKITIVDAAPVVDDVKTETSSLVGSELINDLPINGRRVDSFVLLTPAVTKDADFGLVTFRGMAGGNSFLIDGNDTTNQYYNENAGRTRLGSQISQDAVQEFQVLTSTYSAEFGTRLRRRGQHHHQERHQRRSRHASSGSSAIARWMRATAYAAINPPEVRHRSAAPSAGPSRRTSCSSSSTPKSSGATSPWSTASSTPRSMRATQTWIGCARAGHRGSVRGHQYAAAAHVRPDRPHAATSSSTS